MIITVHGTNNQPVSGATVVAVKASDRSETAVRTTNAQGQADFSSAGLSGEHEFYARQGTLTGQVLVRVVESEPEPEPPASAPTVSLTPASQTQINVSLSAVANATGYRYRVGTSGSWVDLGSGRTAQATGLSAGQSYTIQGRAYNAVGDGPIGSATASTHQPDPDPEPPSAPSAIATAGDGQVALSWGAVSGATGYRVYRHTSNSFGAATQVREQSGVQWTDTGVTNGTTYYYWVTAYNSDGESGPSAVVTATPEAVQGGAVLFFDDFDSAASVAPTTHNPLMVDYSFSPGATMRVQGGFLFPNQRATASPFGGVVGADAGQHDVKVSARIKLSSSTNRETGIALRMGEGEGDAVRGVSFNAKGQSATFLIRNNGLDFAENEEVRTNPPSLDVAKWYRIEVTSIGNNVVAKLIDDATDAEIGHCEGTWGGVGEGRIIPTSTEFGIYDRAETPLDSEVDWLRIESAV